MRRTNRGFTVIELLLVIAIISVILMLTAPALMTVRRKALILGCKSNMYQVYLKMELYRLDQQNDVIPYLFYASEDMLDPEHRTDADTDSSVLAAIVGQDRDILKCPADTGYGGVDYGLTPDGVTCFSCFGHSYVYNNSAYTDPTSPYDRSKPPRFEQMKNPERIIMLTDFSSVWHGAPGSKTEEAKYYLNILYFGGNIEGKGFHSDQAAKTYRNDERRRRWWEVPD